MFEKSVKSVTPICAPRFRKVHLHGSIIYEPKPIDKGHKKRLLISSRKKNNRSNIPLAVSFKFEIRMFRLIRGRSRLINTIPEFQWKWNYWCDVGTCLSFWSFFGNSIAIGVSRSYVVRYLKCRVANVR